MERKSVKEKAIKVGKRAWKFVKDNKFMFIQLGVLVIPTAVGYCSSAETYAADVSIEALQKPLKALSKALTGPIPGAVTGISVALGGCSWAMGWEQQVTQRCVKGAGGGAVAMGAGKFMQDLGFGSGCLF